MGRIDCISNRNIRIIAAYLKSKIGHYDLLFQGIPYPSLRYSSPDAFFLNEDEWTSHKNFVRILRKAREMSSETYFYFFCGASAASLRTFGRLDLFARLFKGPSDGFRRIPFFNKNFTDTKEIEIILPPAYDPGIGKIRTVLKIQHHIDIDVHDDYVGDPYSRGLFSSVPTLWGLPPATVKQPLTPYDPEILFNTEPEFLPFDLDARMEKGNLTIKEPSCRERAVVGKRVFLIPEAKDGKELFLGRYENPSPADRPFTGLRHEAILITETIRRDNRIILKAGEIFKAPYFVLDITFDRSSLIGRLSRVFMVRNNHEETEANMIETINQLRETSEARNAAYHELERINTELAEAKRQVDEYARTLEQKVDERTRELKLAQEELLCFNRGLEKKVGEQVKELERYNELRRYLSPKIADTILSAGGELGTAPRRKMMTIVFSDIRGFSSFTESLEPEELFALLDRYLCEMTGIVHNYEGTLNKIIGDGMLIFFGDPVPTEDHAERAVMMAVEMQKKAAELRGEWLHYGHDFGIGIGINTGFVTVGNIGSEAHRDYTVIGNRVNVAARLVSLAKSGEILISQRTYSRVKGLVEVEWKGEIQVKGIVRPVATYNVRVP